jgi:inositol phosphorylceramide mannosyltransferase catalytic subunit
MNNTLIFIIIFFILVAYFKCIKKILFPNILNGPNIIQTWKDNDIPKKYKNFVNNIKKLNPNSKYIFFTDIEIDNFVKNKFPEYYFTYQNFPYKIQKIDFFRYLAVYYYGGVYLDLDIKLSMTVSDLILNKKAVFPLEFQKNGDKLLQDQGFYGLLGNYAFYAPRGHPFLRAIIKNIVNDRIKNIEYKNGFNYQRYVLYKTGPVMVTQTYIDYFQKNEIDVIKPVPFRKSSFGKYGTHHLMGSWKNDSNKVKNIEKKKKKVGIVIATYNRPEYLKKTLNSIRESDLSDSIICIIDDNSNNQQNWELIQNFNYPNVEIIKIKNKNNLGIRYNLKKGWELLSSKCHYLCNIDSDVIVKKNWISKLIECEFEARLKLNKEHLIVSGFNCTKSCQHRIIISYNKFHVKNTIGGINMFFNQNTYKKIIQPILKLGRPNFGWDWEVCKKAKYNKFPIVVTKPSVVQHIGIDGLNSSKNRRRYDVAEDF